MNLETASQTIALGAVVTVVLVPILGFLLRWMLTDFKNSIVTIAADIRSIASSVSSHETRLALIEQRNAHLEVENVTLRNRQIELGNELAGIKMILELSRRGEHGK